MTSLGAQVSPLVTYSWHFHFRFNLGNKALDECTLVCVNPIMLGVHFKDLLPACKHCPYVELCVIMSPNSLPDLDLLWALLFVQVCMKIAPCFCALFSMLRALLLLLVCMKKRLSFCSWIGNLVWNAEMKYLWYENPSRKSAASFHDQHCLGDGYLRVYEDKKGAFSADMWLLIKYWLWDSSCMIDGAALLIFI